MEEYINRNKLLQQIRLAANRTSLGETSPSFISSIDVVGLIIDAPTEGVIEVKHASWGKPYLRNGHWYRTCSNCLYGTSCGDFDNKEFKPLFCSNCGAQMDGK